MSRASRRSDRIIAESNQAEIERCDSKAKQYRDEANSYEWPDGRIQGALETAIAFENQAATNRWRYR